MQNWGSALSARTGSMSMVLSFPVGEGRRSRISGNYEGVVSRTKQRKNEIRKTYISMDRGCRALQVMLHYFVRVFRELNLVTPRVSIEHNHALF